MVYIARAFKQDCLKQQQELTLCAISAHRQIRIAESFVGTIMAQAHTLYFTLCQNGQQPSLKIYGHSLCGTRYTFTGLLYGEVTWSAPTNY
jgi:hypothetical protein